MENYEREYDLSEEYFGSQMLGLVICMASAFLMGMLVMGLIWWRW